MKQCHIFIIMIILSNSLSHAATIELGKINLSLSGEVIVSTCGVLDSEGDKHVNLGTYSLQNLRHAGNTSPLVTIPFTLTNCLPGGPVTLTFSGTNSIVNSELLALDNGVNSASNIAIEILNPDKTRLAINTKSQSLTADQNGSISTIFFAHYIVTQDNPIPGHANATAQFTVQYD